jgi:hypothetical protein
MRRVALVFGIFVLVAASVFFFWTSELTRIESDFDKLAQTGKVGTGLSQVDWLCFNDGNGTERADFSRAAKRVGLDIEASLKACGVDQSCCLMDTYDSNRSGTIGLVRGNKVSCVSTFGLIYLLEGASAACIRHDRLKVSKERFKERVHLLGRPWVGDVGMQYYKIQEAGAEANMPLPGK